MVSNTIAERLVGSNPTGGTRPSRELSHLSSRVVSMTGDELDAVSYNYVLGQYLGDGHLITSSRVPVLRIYACTDYPAVTDEIIQCIRHVRGTTPGLVRRRNSARMMTVQSYWNRWPCLIAATRPGVQTHTPDTSRRLAGGHGRSGTVAFHSRPDSLRMAAAR